MLKTYCFGITILYSLTLATICLIQIEGIVKEVHINNADKMFHFFSFFVLTFLWYITLVFKFKLNKTKSIVNAFLISVFFGIIIEVLQGSFTVDRHSDIKDVLADTLGALLVSLIIYFKNRILIKKI